MYLAVSCSINLWTILLGASLVILLLIWLTRREAIRTENGNSCSERCCTPPRPPPPCHQTADDFEKKWLGIRKAKLLLSWFGNSPMITVTDPKIIRHVLVKKFKIFHDRPLRNHEMTQPPINKGLFFNFGADWKRIRATLNPTFSTGKLKVMIQDINRYFENLAGKMAEFEKEKEGLDIKRLYGGFTLDTISATSFGMDVDSINQPDGPFIKNIREIFENGVGTWRRIFFTLGNIFPSFIPVVRFLKMDYFDKENLDFFIRHCQAMIESRKSAASLRHDFLQLIVNAQLDASSDVDHPFTIPQKRLSNDKMIAQAFLLFLAGHETTVNTLTFISYELAVNQGVQERVVQEIREQMGRLYREISETVKIKTYTFPEGCTVVVPVYSLHRDPEYWPDPDRFDPDRFSDLKVLQNKFYYMPFGQGPRMCLGMRLAMMELKIAPVHVLRRVRLLPCQETEIPLEPVTHKGTLIAVERPIKLSLEPR